MSYKLLILCFHFDFPLSRIWLKTTPNFLKNLHFQESVTIENHYSFLFSWDTFETFLLALTTLELSFSALSQPLSSLTAECHPVSRVEIIYILMIARFISIVLISPMKLVHISNRLLRIFFWKCCKYPLLTRSEEDT